MCARTHTAICHLTFLLHLRAENKTTSGKRLVGFHLALKAAGDFCVTCATGSRWMVLCDQNHSGSVFPPGSTRHSHTPLECAPSFLFHRLQLMTPWHEPCSRSAACAVLAPEGLQPADHPAGPGACTVAAEQMPLISAEAETDQPISRLEKMAEKGTCIATSFFSICCYLIF